MPRPGRRTLGAVIPDAAPWEAHRQDAAAAGQRLPDDSATSARGRHSDEDQLPQLPRHRHHHLPAKGGKLEIAQQMAGHESARTTGLYDRRNDAVALDEVER